MNKEKREPISIEEKKSIQLEMLKEIDAFCRKNKIKYSLAFGTLIGAVRHKGFIPWDDDIDIMMPLPDMLRFKKIFHSEKLKYCDVDTDNGFEFGFSRITHIKTYNKIGLVAKTYGICIDLYPIVGIPNGDMERVSFFRKASYLFERRMRYRKWRQFLVRFLPIKTIPGFHKAAKEYRDFLLNPDLYGKTGKYYAVAGPLRIRNRTMYDFDIFNEIIEVAFEGQSFLGIAQYDYFLSLMYGDYMTPPPEDQRHPYHIGRYYWKE